MTPRALRIAGTLALAWVSALVCERLHVPLPWMIGPLLLTALGGLTGMPVDTAAPLRDAGQWAIGTALGLYFTPTVLGAIAALAPALLAGIAWALLLGYLFYRLLAAVSAAGTARDHATAYFSAAIGGASEMVVLGERHGGRVDRIAAAHSLRVLIVVIAIPVGFEWAGLKGLDLTPPGPDRVHIGGLLALCALTVAGGWLMRRLHLPNPWLLGAMAVALALTGSGVELSALPKLLTNTGSCSSASPSARASRRRSRAAHRAGWPRWRSARS